ncbi:hypothetical protein [Deinococcus aetherius]|nr:hypothetical protein [Deinococcus aetherius]
MAQHLPARQPPGVMPPEQQQVGDGGPTGAAPVVPDLLPVNIAILLLAVW